MTLALLEPVEAGTTPRYAIDTLPESNAKGFPGFETREKVDLFMTQHADLIINDFLADRRNSFYTIPLIGGAINGLNVIDQMIGRVKSGELDESVVYDFIEEVGFMGKATDNSSYIASAYPGDKPRTKVIDDIFDSGRVAGRALGLFPGKEVTIMPVCVKMTEVNKAMEAESNLIPHDGYAYRVARLENGAFVKWVNSSGLEEHWSTCSMGMNKGDPQQPDLPEISAYQRTLAVPLWDVEIEGDTLAEQLENEVRMLSKFENRSAIAQKLSVPLTFEFDPIYVQEGMAYNSSIWLEEAIGDLQNRNLLKTREGDMPSCIETKDGHYFLTMNIVGLHSILEECNASAPYLQFALTKAYYRTAADYLFTQN